MYKVDTEALKILAQQALDGKGQGGDKRDLAIYDFALKVALVERLEEIADQLDRIRRGPISVEYFKTLR